MNSHYSSQMEKPVASRESCSSGSLGVPGSMGTTISSSEAEFSSARSFISTALIVGIIYLFFIACFLCHTDSTDSTDFYSL